MAKYISPLIQNLDIFNFFIIYRLPLWQQPKADHGEELRPKLYSCFYVRFLLIVWRKHCTKFPGDFIRFHKVTKFCMQQMWRHTGKCIKHFTSGFLCTFCYFYGEKTSYNKVLWHFWRFFMNLWSCKVLNDWPVSLRDAIHANEQTKYVACGLHVKFWNFL